MMMFSLICRAIRCLYYITYAHTLLQNTTRAHYIRDVDYFVAAYALCYMPLMLLQLRAFFFFFAFRLRFLMISLSLMSCYFIDDISRYFLPMLPPVTLSSPRLISPFSFLHDYAISSSISSAFLLSAFFDIFLLSFSIFRYALHFLFAFSMLLLSLSALRHGSALPRFRLRFDDYFSAAPAATPLFFFFVFFFFFDAEP